MKIILGVDESRHSDAAAEFLARTPWSEDAQVVALSACPPLFWGPGEAASPAAIGTLTEEQASYHREVADKAARKIRAAGLRVESRMVMGDPRDVLVETAKAEHADLLVVGSHGRTGWRKLLLGSVASHVVAHAPCHVLVVKLPHA